MHAVPSSSQWPPLRPAADTNPPLRLPRPRRAWGSQAWPRRSAAPRPPAPFCGSRPRMRRARPVSNACDVPRMTRRGRKQAAPQPDPRTTCAARSRMPPADSHSRTWRPGTTSSPAACPTTSPPRLRSMSTRPVPPRRTRCSSPSSSPPRDAWEAARRSRARAVTVAPWCTCRAHRPWPSRIRRASTRCGTSRSEPGPWSRPAPDTSMPKLRRRCRPRAIRCACRTLFCRAT